MAYYGTEGATIRIEPSGKINVYVAGGSTGNSLETAVVQLAADALGAMVGRFAELWLVQGYRDYDLDQAVDQLTLLWGNALGLAEDL